MKRQELIFLFASIFLVTVAWLIFTIIHNIRTSTITDVLSIQIKPITASFDEETINTLKKRQKIDPNYRLQGTTDSQNASLSSQLKITPSPSQILSPTPVRTIPTLITPTTIVSPTETAITP